MEIWNLPNKPLVDLWFTECLFPKNALSGEEWKFSLLGLGDIVLPGLFISFLYRYDFTQKRTPIIYYVCTISYVLGLATTIAVMHIFEHAQVCILI